MATTTELMQQRFHEASAAADAIRAQVAPLRAQRDALAVQAQAIEAQMAVLADQIRTIEAPLFDLDNERGNLVRALGGKTGTPG